MKKYSAKKFLNILKEIQDGATITETCYKYKISNSTYYNWLNKYQLIETSDFKRVKAENTKLMLLIKKETACEFFRYHGVLQIQMIFKWRIP